MGANCNTTPPLLKAIFFDYRFDLTNFDPPPKFHRCNLSLYICVKWYFLDLCRFDLMYLTPLPKFHRCISSCYTCVKWYFRSMQIWLDVVDPRQNFMDAFDHITPQPFNQSASSHSRHNKNHVLPKRSTMLKSISCLINYFLLSPCKPLMPILPTLFSYENLNCNNSVSDKLAKIGTLAYYMKTKNSATKYYA